MSRYNKAALRGCGENYTDAALRGFGDNYTDAALRGFGDNYTDAALRGFGDNYTDAALRGFGKTKLKKGSEEAKKRMAYLRSLRGKGGSCKKCGGKSLKKAKGGIALSTAIGLLSAGISGARLLGNAIKWGIERRDKQKKEKQMQQMYGRGIEVPTPEHPGFGMNGVIGKTKTRWQEIVEKWVKDHPQIFHNNSIPVRQPWLKWKNLKKLVPKNEEYKAMKETLREAVDKE